MRTPEGSAGQDASVHQLGALQGHAIPATEGPTTTHHRDPACTVTVDDGVDAAHACTAAVHHLATEEIAVGNVHAATVGGDP